MTEVFGKHISFPFRIGSDGRTKQTLIPEEHIFDQIKQLILTNLGERPFLPEFGGPVRKLVFENVDETKGIVIKARLTQAINKWLVNRIILKKLDVVVNNETIEIRIDFTIPGNDKVQTMKFQRNVN